LARWRRKLDLRQVDLGELCGCTGSAISNYERGTRPIPLRVIVAAARGMGVPQISLFEVHDVKAPKR
jgi:transcriptional regulator with XRE-family HTH domain